MIKAGIIGGAGYTAGELIRLLVNHPEVEIHRIVSQSQTGKKVETIHEDLVGETELTFAGSLSGQEDVVFMCMGHGKSREYLDEHGITGNPRLIDLSQDFRLKEKNIHDQEEFIYGLPELQRDHIRNARHVANPGCFATAVQLALLPLANAGRLRHDVHIQGITGSTGAGQSPSPTTHFSWRNNNVSVYKAFTHQHLLEVGESLHSLDENAGELLFVPMRGNFARGIFVTAYTRFDGTIEDGYRIYREFYQEAAFTHVTEEPLHLKQVVNTNKCLVQLTRHNGYLMATCIIDNLLKGASGQAVQNMNLLFGFDETMGLTLKSSYF